MTIGIAAFGTHAGAAVYDAVLATELLGRGAITGFAVFAVLDASGFLHYRVTQRGGVTSLDIPAEWKNMQVAALISSGPDRPVPLTQFLAGAEGRGLVSGHRLPNQAGKDGTPLNEAALSRMISGEHPQSAVDAVLQAHPEWDAGLVAIDTQGRLGMGNSARVTRRDDLGAFRRETPVASLGLLHNSIYARSGMTDDVGELAWARLQGRAGGWCFISLNRTVPLTMAELDCVHIDEDGAIVALDIANPRVMTLERPGAAAYLGAEVRRLGEPVGKVITELYVPIRGGCAQPSDTPIQNNLLAKLY